MATIKKGGIKEALATAMPTEGGENEPQVDRKIRTDWNSFLDYLEKSGFKGKPDLDKGGYGYKLFDEYVKQTPGTSLGRDKLPLIRKELLNYRNWALEQNKSTAPGTMKLAAGVNENNFMRHVIENEKTGDPNYPGSNLTMIKFPDSYLKFVDLNNNTSTVKNQGFAAIKK